jgi:hypothetical protein
MTAKTLHHHWLRTKRHLRSVATSPRAQRDARRALAEAARPCAGARGGLCRRPPVAA